MALSPLLVFLGVYLVSSLIVGDFYKTPIAAAFIIAAAYAIIITKGSVKERVDIFSQGASNKNVMMMIWIFILAGAFANTAKSIGAIDATVNLTLAVLPGKTLYAGLFVASCFISMSIGTSVGTIVALMPIASGLASEIGVDAAYIAAIIVGGSFFGDNLSFISDTTIASTRSQGCSMRDKFHANLWIAAPAALIVCAIYVSQGFQVNVVPSCEEVQLMKLLPYLAVIIMAIFGVNVIVVLACGIGLNALISIAFGCLTWEGFMASMGKGIGDMGELIIVTMFAGGVLEIIRHNGGIDFIVNGMTKSIKGKRGAEFAIGGLVALANLCTANNTIAIISTGDIARNIARKFGVDPRKSACLMDTFSCLVQGYLPYGAQLLMAGALAGASSVEIMTHMYYPAVLGVIVVLSILLRFPKKYS